MVSPLAASLTSRLSEATERMLEERDTRHAEMLRVQNEMCVKQFAQQQQLMNSVILKSFRFAMTHVGEDSPITQAFISDLSQAVPAALPALVSAVCQGGECSTAGGREAREGEEDAGSTSSNYLLVVTTLPATYYSCITEW